MHNKSANGYAIKSANRLIPRHCKRRYGRWSGKASSPAIFGHRYALTRSSSNARTSTRRSHRARRGRPVYAQPVSPRVSYNTPNLAGRWSLLQVEPLNDTERMLALAENMLDRYGIISRQAVIAENIPGGFPSMQTLCRSMEDSGRIMRGRFVEGLGVRNSLNV